MAGSGSTLPRRRDRPRKARLRAAAAQPRGVALAREPDRGAGGAAARPCADAWHRRQRVSRLLPGRGGGDRDGELARGGRPRLLSAALGRAAPRRVPRRRRLRAAAADARRRRPRDAAAARAARADAGGSGALRTACARGRVCERARRRRRLRPARPRLPCAPATRHAGRSGRAARRDRLPLCGRRRPDGGVLHPEPLHGLRLGRRRARHRRRPAEPRSLLRSPWCGRARPPPLSHGHPGDAAPRRGPLGAVPRDGRLPPGAGASAGRLRARGRRPRPPGHARILVDGDELVGGSDRHKDGIARGF